jgi:hypothetical protein
LAHPGRERPRGRAYGPAAAHERGETARVREGRRRRRGPHVPERAGGGRERRQVDEGGMNRPSAGRTRPPVARFLDSAQVP